MENIKPKIQTEIAFFVFGDDHVMIKTFTFNEDIVLKQCHSFDKCVV